MSKRNIIPRSGKQLYLNQLFLRGMLHTTSELKEGYAKVITNFDISPTGDSAVPRKAFKSYQIAVGGKPITNRYFYACKFLQSINAQHYISFDNTITESDYVSHNEGDSITQSEPIEESPLGISMYSRYNNAFNPSTTDSISVNGAGANTSSFDNNEQLKRSIKYGSFNYSNDKTYFLSKDVSSSINKNYSIDTSEYKLFDYSKMNYYIPDGDSGKIYTDTETFEFRLACINCPEYTEEWHDYGQALLNRVFEISVDKIIYYKKYGVDDYNRNISKVYLKIDNNNTFVCLNKLILCLGLAKISYVYDNITDSDLIKELIDIQSNCSYNMFSDSDIDPFYNYSTNVVTYPTITIKNTTYNSGEYHVQALRLNSESYPSNKVRNKIDRVEFIYDDSIDAIGFIGRLISNGGVILYKGPMYVRAKATRTYDSTNDCYNFNNPNFTIYLPNNNLNGKKVDIIEASTNGYNLLDSKLFHVEDTNNKSKQFSILGLSVTDTDTDDTTIIDQAIRNQVVRLNASVNTGYFVNKSVTSTDDYGFNLEFKLVNDNTYFDNSFISYKVNKEDTDIISINKTLLDSSVKISIPIEMVYNNKIKYEICEYDKSTLLFSSDMSDSGLGTAIFNSVLEPKINQLIYINNKYYLIKSVIINDSTESGYSCSSSVRSIDSLPEDYPIVCDNSNNTTTYYYIVNASNGYINQSSVYIKDVSLSIFNNNFTSKTKVDSNNQNFIKFNYLDGNVFTSNPVQLTDEEDVFDIKILAKEIAQRQFKFEEETVTNIFNKPLAIGNVTCKLELIVVNNLTNLNKCVEYSNNDLKLVNKTSINRNTYFFSKWEYCLNNEDVWKTIYESDEPNYIMDTSNSNYVEKCDQSDDVTWEIPVSGNIILKYTIQPKLVASTKSGTYLKEIVDGVEKPIYICNNLQEITLTMPIFKIGDTINLLKESDIRQNVDIKNATRIGIFNRQTYLYGPYTKSNFIQFSKFEESWYYPFPYYNVEFDEPITYVTTFRNNLIVFTKYNIWSMSGSESILECTKSKIYENLSTSITDIHLVSTIGKYLMFFNNNMGYLIVPNDYSFATDNSNIKVYKLTENVINLMNNPEHYLRTRIGILPSINIANSIECKSLSYTQNNEIYIILNYTVNDYKSSIMLVYNIDYKYWKTYDVSNSIFDEIIDTYVCEPSYNNQFITTKDNNICLTILDNTSSNTCIDKLYKNSEVISDSISTYIESGYLSVDTMNDKRFKDLIIEFDRLSGKDDLIVNCNFYIDGSPILINDSDALVVDSTSSEETPIKPISILEVKDNSKINSISIYDEITNTFKQYYGVLYKLSSNNTYFTSNRTHLRIPIYGKGRLPSFSLEMKKDNPYEFINYSIIYKEKNINTRR